MNEIFLYGPVGGWLCGFTAADLALALRSMGDVKLRVHSEGGDAMEGIAVANVVRAHKGKVVVQVDGLCASAATPVLCTADEVIIAPGGLVMLHEVRAIIEGDAAELRAQADVNDKLSASYRALYAEKTGKSDDELRELVAKGGWAVGSWLTATEALALGLADRLGDEVDPQDILARRPAAAARVLNSPAARFLVATATKGTAMTKNQIALRKALGLPADAPAAAVKAAMEKAEAEKKPDGEGEPDGDEGDDDKKKPPKDEAEGEPDGDEEEETAALKDALAEAKLTIQSLQKQVTAAPAKAEATEKKVRADVDKWVSEGRIAPERRDHYLALHRQGKAQRIVRHLDPGVHTTSQRLASGKVGARVEVPTPPTPPAAAEKPVSRVAQFEAAALAERGIPFNKKS